MPDYKYRKQFSDRAWQDAVLYDAGKSCGYDLARRKYLKAILLIVILFICIFLCK